MAAPEEHDSPTEAPQPAVGEEETKTFKDLVSVDDADSFLSRWRPLRQRPVALESSWLTTEASGA